MSRSPTPTVILAHTNGTLEQRTQQQCLHRAALLADHLAAEQLVRVGDRVAILACNSIEFLEISIGVAGAGGCPVPINWHATSHEIAHVLSDSGTSVLFCDPDLHQRAAHAIMRAGVRCAVFLTTANDSDIPALDDLIGAAAGPIGHIDGALAASLGVIYTSGTTGSPKGVDRELMTPAQILSVAGSTATRMGIRDGGCVLIPGPLYHTSPNSIATLALRMGSTLVLMERFDAEQFLSLVEQFAVEHAKVVPTMLSRLAALPADVRDRYDVSSLTHVVHSAAPCPPTIKHAAIGMFGDAVTEFYGCSEAGPICWISAAEWLTRPGSVGRPVDGADVRVVDDQGEVVPVGTVGHVQVKGADYWPRFRYIGDGRLQPQFLDVGDNGYLDEDGYLYLAGRSADIVNIGGTNIYTAEIEAAAIDHPDVLDAAALGTPTGGDLGEEITLYVVPSSAELDMVALVEHLTQRLSTVKLPSVIRERTDLPRDDNGKLYKARL